MSEGGHELERGSGGAHVSKRKKTLFFFLQPVSVSNTLSSSQISLSSLATEEVSFCYLVHVYSQCANSEIVVKMLPGAQT